ncbi:hypothetical protein [Roseimicrobium gellanilyticum]|uniref:hypothetical protein n=1 Tax=Roseimicrobium gellanilyticum TaxID=748857 RepID=UPI0011BDAB64|nr:hypothetical protein [Roseimicrobium gellanilyticum]
MNKLAELVDLHIKRLEEFHAEDQATITALSTEDQSANSTVVRESYSRGSRLAFEISLGKLRDIKIEVSRMLEKGGAA